MKPIPYQEGEGTINAKNLKLSKIYPDVPTSHYYQALLSPPLPMFAPRFKRKPRLILPTAVHYDRTLPEPKSKFFKEKTGPGTTALNLIPQ